MRDWIALYPSILDSEKWGELPSDTHRLAWVEALLLGARQPVEGRFDSQAKLGRLLGKEGITDAGAVVEVLVSQGCLDRDGEEVVIRGWEKWQRRWRGPSDDPQAKAQAERERYWRGKAEALERRLAEVDPPGSSPGSDLGVSGERLKVPGIEERRGEETEEKRGEGVAPAPAIPGPDDPPDSLDRFYELTLLRPWGKPSGRWLREIEEGYGGPEVVRSALDVEYARNPTSQDLISRVEARLAREADRKRQEKAKAPRKSPDRNGVDPEVAARQRAALTGMIGEAGKVPEKRSQG